MIVCFHIPRREKRRQYEPRREHHEQEAHVAVVYEQKHTPFDKSLFSAVSRETSARAMLFHLFDTVHRRCLLVLLS